MEQILSSIFPKKPQLSNDNSLQTISIENSSILVHVDTTTFASPLKERSTKIRFEFVDEPIPVKEHNPKIKYTFVNEPTKSTGQRKITCVIGCKDFRMIHRSPLDETSREIWRKKLKLEVLRKTHRVCDRHFRKTLGVNKRRLPGWAVPDSPEASDSEENYATKKNKNTFFINLPRDVELSSVLLKKDKETEVNPKDLQKQLLSLDDILACK